MSELPFGAVNIFRPSLLLRDRDEFQLGERVAERLLRHTSFLLPGTLGRGSYAAS